VLYNKIQYEGWGRVANTAWSKAKCCICLYLPQDPTPSAIFYRAAQVYGAFTDLLGLRGRIMITNVSAFIRFSKLLWFDASGLLSNAPWGFFARYFRLMQYFQLGDNTVYAVFDIQWHGLRTLWLKLALRAVYRLEKTRKMWCFRIMFLRIL